ncbi:FAD dependent oxidoreductase [Nitzschia inconspicua]|uniref:FAD dependent oxidoreductase n=1 Tax=Nitzschia inconspicua TaxID=303405 RepID=A0A9K3KWV9_9STRA|nr:FAD dependent oxidoreductase [Nitzschia inconspicua]
MASRVLVVGSGVLGLRTAVELTRRRIPVVLRSPVHPLHPSNCSQGAGGLWMPFHCDDPRTDRWAIETLDEIYPFAVDEENLLVRLQYALSFKRTHEGPDTEDFLAKDYHKGTGGKSQLPSWSTDDRLKFQNMTLEQVAWQNIVYKLKLPSLSIAQGAGYNHAWFFETPIIDCPKMMESMLEEVDMDPNDVNVETGVYYESIHQVLEEAKSLNCDAVVNCTGLGASKICQDSEIIGGRGVLLLYDRETCVRLPHPKAEDPLLAAPPEQLHDACIMVESSPWGSDEYPCYMIVRGDTIVVGGTYLEGDDEPAMRPEERKRLLENARILGVDTEASKPKGEWVGHRPYRPVTRCELDSEVSNNGLKLVHCYGTGGSGWTVYAGVAKDATDLILAPM